MKTSVRLLRAVYVVVSSVALLETCEITSVLPDAADDLVFSWILGSALVYVAFIAMDLDPFDTSGSDAPALAAGERLLMTQQGIPGRLGALDGRTWKISVTLTTKRFCAKPRWQRSLSLVNVSLNDVERVEEVPSIWWFGNRSSFTIFFAAHLGLPPLTMYVYDSDKWLEAFSSAGVTTESWVDCSNQLIGR